MKVKHTSVVDNGGICSTISHFVRVQGSQEFCLIIDFAFFKISEGRVPSECGIWKQFLNFYCNEINNKKIDCLDLCQLDNTCRAE